MMVVTRVVYRSIPGCPNCGTWYRIEERLETWMTTWLWAKCDNCGAEFRGVEGCA